MANVDSYLQTIKGFDRVLANNLLDDEVLFIIDCLRGNDSLAFEYNMEMYASTRKSDYKYKIISIIKAEAARRGNQHVLNLL